ncbi:MAG: 4-hydroxy-tetrahydrodipicolinate synthase [Bacteroidota bacterium]
MKKFIPKGTFTAIVTPFKQDGSIDYAKFEKLLDFQIENKIEGIVVCGSTGETATLTLSEKKDVIRRSVEYVAGRTFVIAGTGSNETKATLELTTFAKDAGADAVLLVAPYYNKPSQKGLYEHFSYIAKGADIPQIIYNVPGRTAVNILPKTQLQIAVDCPNVVATKEASGNIEQMMEIIKDAPEHFVLLSGDDALTLSLIPVGAKGIVSVLSNYAPKQFGDLVRLALDGKYAEAVKLHYQLFDLMQLNFIESNPAPVKAALAHLGLIEEVIRLPLITVSPENRKIIKEAMLKAGLL